MVGARGGGHDALMIRKDDPPQEEASSLPHKSNEEDDVAMVVERNLLATHETLATFAGSQFMPCRHLVGGGA